MSEIGYMYGEDVAQTMSLHEMTRLDEEYGLLDTASFTVFLRPDEDLLKPIPA